MKTFRLFLIGILIVPLTQMNGSSIEITDATEHTIVIVDHSSVVSVGGDITEIIYALGAEGNLVARDDTSYYPETVKELPSVGYMRSLSAEGILSLNPSLILATEGSGPPTTLKQLRETGVPLVLVSQDYTHKSVVNKINLIAKTLGREEQGFRLIQRLNEQKSALTQSLQSYRQTPTVLSLMSIQRGQLMAAGKNTSADAMIQLAGGKNALSGFVGYKQISAESVIKAQPEFILLPSHGATQMGGADVIATMPELRTTPAVLNDNTVVMDSLYLLMFGPRYLQAAKDLAREIHPDFEMTQ